jgi:probable phosphoglycerate mutase
VRWQREEIFLVRHGEYDWDNQPSPVKGLTVRGVQQAKLTAQRLRNMPVTAIYSSDLMRAVETAEIIRAEFDGVTYKKRKELRECYLSNPNQSKVPKELIEQGERQAEEAFCRYLRPTRGNDKSEIIVSHGNLIRHLASRVVASSPDSWFRMKTFNCGITEIAIDADGGKWLVSYNDVGHLPAEIITEGIPSRSTE